MSPYIFSLIIHDNGDFKITLSGYEGAEYYNDCEQLYKRLDQFLQLDLDVGLTLYFTKNNSRRGFYWPDYSVRKEWAGRLCERGFLSVEFEVANVETPDGYTSLPEFYYHREHKLVGFTPVAEHKIAVIVPYEKKMGFDVQINESLYK